MIGEDESNLKVFSYETPVAGILVQAQKLGFLKLFLVTNMRYVLKGFFP